MAECLLKISEHKLDIALRFNKDMLVLSGSVEAGLKHQDFDIENNLDIANILEPDTIKDVLRPYTVAGAQCIVSNTKNLLKAVLSHQKLDNRIEELASASLRISNSLNPQHVIVELGNCGLPLDDQSKNSLIEFKEQYVFSGRIFEKLSKSQDCTFDAYFLSGFYSISNMKCALMGLRQVSDKPVFVSVELDKDGRLNSKEDIYDYANFLQEYGATVAGIKIKDGCDIALKLCKRLRAGCDLPILVEFDVSKNQDTPYYYPDSMKEACIYANKGGAQFLRATGQATPAYTSVLSAYSSQMPINFKIGI